MFETEDALEGRVRPLKFQALDEDSHTRQGGNGRHQNREESRLQQQQASLRRRRLPTRPNFSLEYSYPAVILEDICFSVDKSQQQANFLKECIFRFNQVLAPICGHPAASEYQEKVQILKSINLSVPCGSIFGLLGPSSCGKTTLLRCLLGLLKPSSGSIRLFGKQKTRVQKDQQGGRKNNNDDGEEDDDCKVPGSNVGYMPQDLGLYEDFTIAQLLTMFGRYMRMNSTLICERIKFMASFLELPDVHRQVQTLSGGQKRRVSFAIACLHMPPLIILDEPTVGVDPLLRRSIWKYLRRLASEENKTIIITTHYIEEAAQADQVALMRAGEILVQDTPGNIMRSHQSATLEEAFLKICNNVGSDGVRLGHSTPQTKSNGKQVLPLPLPPPSTIRLMPQPQFNWHDELNQLARAHDDASGECARQQTQQQTQHRAAADLELETAYGRELTMSELKLRAQEKLALYDKLRCCQLEEQQQQQHDPSATGGNLSLAHTNGATVTANANAAIGQNDNFQMITNNPHRQHHVHQTHRQQRRLADELNQAAAAVSAPKSGKTKKFLCSPKRSKFILNEADDHDNTWPSSSCRHLDAVTSNRRNHSNIGSDDENSTSSWRTRAMGNLSLYYALLYKNYRRNVNSIPLMVFQFMLPMIQMISFCLCVGGRPTNVGLGIVNRDQPASFGGVGGGSGTLPFNLSGVGGELHDLAGVVGGDSLSLSYLSFLDKSMLAPRHYESLSSALEDVRRSKLWAVVEIGENFTSALEARFDLENFYQLDAETISQSIIRIYPDRSNKILDMICQRSLIDSFRAFLSNEFEHFKRLPIEIGKPIFDIKPNIISNSIDGYTESIAPGLLASLTYIMAAGLTTFIMVVERSDGILERTYTSGIHPISYLLAHAIFRSFVMMIQIALVLGLTFYVLKQPIVGSIWLAYAMLMVLNITGIAYGLLISSIVTDQNGAALTIVSSLVVKITLSGILWPFEAIPYWLRTICYVQPLTMPVQALKSITLKGASLGDASVNLGFLVSITWLIVFLTISAKRFKFYQH